MTTIELSFTFCNEDHTQLSNELVRNIRRYVAETLQNCGFGAVQETASGKFDNLHAVPINDQYYDMERELFISYVWWYPIQEGQGRYDQLVSVGLPQIKTHLRTNYQIYSIIRLCLT